jgi:hypothetical protein
MHFEASVDALVASLEGPPPDRKKRLAQAILADWPEPKKRKRATPEAKDGKALAKKKKSGAANRKAAKEKAVAEADEEDELAPKFEVRGKAVLLTWQLPEYAPSQYYYETVMDQVEALDAFSKVVRASICVERGRHLHMHAYLEFGKKYEGTIDDFATFFGPCCDVQTNTVSGSGYRAAADRGHFYVACHYKATFVANRVTYKPASDYVVRTDWCLRLWGSDKIAPDMAIPCMAEFRCLSPAAEAMVKRVNTVNAGLKRQAWIDERQRRLKKTLVAYKPCEVGQCWLAEYQKEKFRYDFIWYYGPSKFGKTKRVESWFDNPFTHESAIAWEGYDPLKHDCVIFEDCKDMNDYICRHKSLFKGEKVTKVGTSKTNWAAQTVDCVAKPIVVFSNNERPQDPWVVANCYFVEVTEPTWIDAQTPQSIEDVCEPAMVSTLQDPRLWNSGVTYTFD